MAAVAAEEHQLWTEAAPGDGTSAANPTPTAASGIGLCTQALGGDIIESFDSFAPLFLK